LYPGANSQLSLDESDALFAKIAKSFSAGIYIYDLNKRLNTYMNDEYTNITGHTLEEINSLGSDEFISFFHPDDLQAVLSHMEQVSTAVTDEVFKLEYRFKHKNGSWVKLLSLDRVFDRDKDNTPISFIGTFFSV
jgi:PAS domain S-box-containing protein